MFKHQIHLSPEEGDKGGGSEPKIKIGGKEYTEKEASELISKGTDYTKKTQQLAEKAKTVEDLIKLSDRLAEDPEGTAEQLKEIGKKLKAKLADPNNSTDEAKRLREELQSVKEDIRLKEELEKARKGSPIFAKFETDIIDFMLEHKIDNLEAGIALWEKKFPAKAKEADDFPVIPHRRAPGSNGKQPERKPGERAGDYYVRVQQWKNGG